MRRAKWRAASIHLTWFLKLFIEHPPGLCDPLKALLHGLDVHIGTVALWELDVTVAPAVAVLADKFAFSITGYVAESTLHKTFSQIVWEDHLQACKTKLGLVPSSNCELGEWQWKCSGNIVLAEFITDLIKWIFECQTVIDVCHMCIYFSEECLIFKNITW